MPIREPLVFGQDWIDVELPDDTHFVSPGVSLPLPAAPDLGAAVQEALDAPLDTKPLAELARDKRRVCVAFDDPTVPCLAGAVKPELVKHAGFVPVASVE